MKPQAAEPRLSIWSVRPTLVPLYFALFTLAVISGKALIVWYEVVVVTADGPPETLIGIIQGVGWVGLASAICIFTLTELTEYAMVMANWFRQQYLEPLKERQREEGREKGREEGREEGRDIERERVRSEMLKRGIELTKEDEDALFNPNGHSK